MNMTLTWNKPCQVGEQPHTVDLTAAPTFPNLTDSILITFAIHFRRDRVTKREIEFAGVNV